MCLMMSCMRSVSRVRRVQVRGLMSLLNIGFGFGSLCPSPWLLHVSCGSLENNRALTLISKPSIGAQRIQHTTELQDSVRSEERPCCDLAYSN